MQRGIPAKKRRLSRVRPHLQELLKDIPVPVGASFMNCLCENVPKQTVRAQWRRTTWWPTMDEGNARKTTLIGKSKAGRPSSPRAVTCTST